MNTALQRYIEPLGNDELLFLIAKERKERKQYYKIFRIMMVVSFVLPFITAWYRAAEGAPNAFSQGKFFTSAGALLFISCFSIYFTYRLNLRKVQQDIRQQTKTIETSHVTRKIYVGTKKTYHLYIDSVIKLSIEVSEADFQRFDEGDEVSIEYTTHSHQYLGYF